MGAASASGVFCPDQELPWVPTTPLSAEERRIWRRALNVLRGTPDEECRRAGALLRALERGGRVSVWTEPDTTGGLIYFGATYLAADLEPLAIQFWAAAFRRPFSWMIGAMAHEAFHALRPEGSEPEALEFGNGCARADERPALGGIIAGLSP